MVNFLESQLQRTQVTVNKLAEKVEAFETYDSKFNKIDEVLDKMMVQIKRYFLTKVFSLLLPHIYFFLLEFNQKKI